ncbi:MAG TPA: zf-HC2 domain-containing protein [bacterium]
MKCQETIVKLELYLDNELSVQEKAEIEAHLLTCAGCAKQLANLKSLDSLGKREFFIEPSPLYWKELRQNIMSEIKVDSKKLFSVVALLQRLKNYIFPGKLSFRLAGLVATAVIVFFIIHISFIRQGKFDLPENININDSISIPKQETQSIQSKDEEMRKALGVVNESVPQTIPKAMSFQDKGSEQLSTHRKEPQAVINIEDREIRKLHEPSMLFENQSNVEAKEVKEQWDKKNIISDGSVPSQKDAKRMMAKPAYMPLEKNEMAEKDAFRVQSVGASRSMTLHDTSVFKFELISRKAQEVNELTNKIKIWEDYIQTQPELDLLRKAKYEQARLYFDLAQEKMNDNQVKQAISFYEKNFEYLATATDSFQIERELDTLRQLLKKR